MDIDREEVIIELIAGIEDAFHRCHCGLGITMEKALALLKAQEPIKPILTGETFLCGKCGAEVLIYEEHLFEKRYNYCPECGQAVKWE